MLLYFNLWASITYSLSNEEPPIADGIAVPVCVAESVQPSPVLEAPAASNCTVICSQGALGSPVSTTIFSVQWPRNNHCSHYCSSHMMQQHANIITGPTALFGLQSDQELLPTSVKMTSKLESEMSLMIS